MKREKLEICEKCEHFVQHYTYSKWLGFKKIDCGHCYKRQMNKKECALFEEASENYDEEVSILNQVLKYEKQLKDLIFNIKTLSGALDNLKKEIISLELEKKHN